MTREEAIRWLKLLKSSPLIYGEYTEAIDMAIEALSQPIACKDFRIDDGHIYCSPEVADRVVEALRERPQGEWVLSDNPNILYECSNCGHGFPHKRNGKSTVFYFQNYCPNCGAIMKGGAE